MHLIGNWLLNCKRKGRKIGVVIRVLAKLIRFHKGGGWGMVHIKRKKIIIITVFVLILAYSSFNAFAQQNISSLVKKVQPAVVLITIYDAQGNESGQGSGFFINQKGEIITNWHVISDASSAMVKTTTGAMFKVKGIVAKDEKRDLAKIVLDAKDISFPFLSMSSVVPNIGEQIFVIGSPYGLESTVSDGLVSALREIPDVGNIIQISAPVSPGSSGSPVINLNGQVVGIASFQSIKGQNLNFAISAEDIIELSKIAQKSVMPLGSALPESKTYLSRINPEVQLKENSWIKIVNEVVVEESPEEFYDRIYSDMPEIRNSDVTKRTIEYDKQRGIIRREIYVEIQFLKPCKATVLKTDDPIRDNIIGNFDHIVPAYRCDYQTKVFVTLFSQSGKEIKTDSAFPISYKREREVFPGEKVWLSFYIGTDATYWYVWVPK